jgi:hypothetical protein
MQTCISAAAFSTQQKGSDMQKCRRCNGSDMQKWRRAVGQKCRKSSGSDIQKCSIQNVRQHSAFGIMHVSSAFSIQQFSNQNVRQHSAFSIQHAAERVKHAEVQKVQWVSQTCRNGEGQKCRSAVGQTCRKADGRFLVRAKPVLSFDIYIYICMYVYAHPRDRHTCHMSL